MPPKTAKKDSSQPSIPCDAAELCQAVINAVHDPVHVVDASLRFVFANDAFRQWMRRLGKPDILYGRPLMETLTFLDKGVKEEYEETLQSGKPLYTEDRTTVNGQDFVTETQKIPLRGADGKVTHIITVIHDISERVYAAEKIQQMNALLERRVMERTQELENAKRKLEMEIAERQIMEFELRQQSLFSETLARVIADLNSTLELDTLLDRILANLGLVVPHDAADVMLIEGGAARIVRCKGHEKFAALEDLLGLRFDLASTENLARVFHKRQPLMISDVRDYPGWVRLPISEWIRAHICVPILTGDEVIGFLNVDSAKPGFFTPRDTARLKAFADYAGLAIKNARLYAEIQRQLEEQSRARQALSESEQRFSTLMDQTAVGIADSSGRLVQVSRRYAEMLGYTPEEVQQLTFQQITHPEDLAEDLQNMRRMEAGEINNFIIEKRYRRKDGSFVWVNLNIAALRGSDGKLLQTVAVAQDITPRKQMEEQIREGERRFRSLFNQGAVGAVDERGYFVEASPLLCEMLGYTLEELRRLTFQQITHPEDLPKNLELTRRAYAGEMDSFAIEKRFIRKDGKQVWTTIHISPLRDAHGRAQGDLAVVQDITARKQAEESLRQSEQMFRQFFDLSPVGLAITSLDGRYLRVNRAYCKMLGYSEEELTRMTYEDVSYPDEEEKKTNRELRQTMLRGESGEGGMEKRFRAKDGRVLNAILRIALVRDSENTPLYVIGQIVDITERKKLESEMMLAQKMAGLGSLAAGIAHELNSPLQIITAASENLLKKLEEGSLAEEKLRRRLLNIHQSAWRMAETIRSLRRYTRSSDEAFTPHDLNKIVRDTLLLAKPQLTKNANIRIETELAKDLPMMLCAPSQISQALINLLSNARDALPRGGKIIIQTAYDEDAQRFLLRVSDTGEGIPPQIQGRVFDPFFTTKGIGKGSGLGLSIVMGIVRAHGGSVDLQSAPEAGSVFSLYFPLRPPAPAPPLSGGTFDE